MPRQLKTSNFLALNFFHEYSPVAKSAETEFAQPRIAALCNVAQPDISFLWILAPLLTVPKPFPYDHKMRPCVNPSIHFHFYYKFQRQQ